MKPAETGRNYDAIADRWSSAEFPRDNGIAAHERALAFLSSKRRALDVGCGCNGRIVDLLLRHGFAIEGVDVSARMVELARLRNPGIAFHHADICEWSPPGRYDFITAWDSLWHVPLAQQAAVLRKLLDALQPNGVCIFTMGGLEDGSEKTDATMGPEMYYATIGIPATLMLLSSARCTCRHLEYDQHPESHVYVIAQKAW